MPKRTLAALCALLVAASTLAVVAQPAAAHSQTTTKQHCSYDPFAGNQCWTETVNVSHTHACGAGMTGAYPNCYPIPPANQNCGAGTTGTYPNCYPIPSDNTNNDKNKGGTDKKEPDKTEPDKSGTKGTRSNRGTDNRGGTGTRTVSKDPCGDWASATRDALYTYGADGLPNITPPPAGCGATALQLARFLNRVATSDPLDQVVLSAAESEAMRNALDALGSEYNKYITTWDSLTAAEKVLVSATACLAGAVVVPPAAYVLSPGCGVAVGLADAWLPRPTVEPDGDDSPSDDSPVDDAADENSAGNYCGPWTASAFGGRPGRGGVILFVNGAPYSEVQSSYGNREWAIARCQEVLAGLGQ